MIVPSEEDVKAETGQGSVTRPFVTETYRCVAQYETKDTKNKAFKVAADEKVDVLIKDKAGGRPSRLGPERPNGRGFSSSFSFSFSPAVRLGWWLVENEEKRMAWFPAPYLEKDEEEDGADGAPERGSGCDAAVSAHLRLGAGRL